jgi:hypothetical protein
VAQALPQCAGGRNDECGGNFSIKHVIERAHFFHRKDSKFPQGNFCHEFFAGILRAISAKPGVHCVSTVKTWLPFNHC